MSVSADGKTQLPPQFTRFCAMWGVTCIKTFSPIALPQPFTQLNSVPDVTTYSAPGAFPRAWVVPSAFGSPAGDDGKAFAAMDGPAFNPAQAAVVDGNAPALPMGAAAGTAVIVQDDPEHLEIQANSPGLLVLSDSWYPRWTATVDGSPAPVLRVNCAMRGVVVPRAGARVRMDYANPALVPLACLSWVAVLAAIAFVVRDYRRGREREAHP
jgi:outer membrane protein assembly factor BamB